MFKFSKVHGYFVLHFPFMYDLPLFSFPAGAFSGAQQPGERRELGFG
jgi:hypothetical protein